MASRSNACSELTRFWLEQRHGCLVTESVPVPVPSGQSDLDLVAIQAADQAFSLPNGEIVGPRLIVETKDEHDFDPKGLLFGKFLRSDHDLLDQHGCIPRIPKSAVKFSMLRQEHHDVASRLFGQKPFDRVFVVHAVDQATLDQLRAPLLAHRIHVLTISELVMDLRDWYRSHPRPSGLRHSLVGDLWHLLVGFCGFDRTD